MRRFLIPIALLSAACGDPAGPPVEEIAGLYTATVFEATEGGDRTDFLAVGGSLDLSLLPSGGVNGQLNLPGGGTGGSTLKVNVGGSWRVRDGEVTLDLRPTIFLDALRFTASSGLLSSDQTVDGVHYDLTLRQTAPA